MTIATEDQLLNGFQPPEYVYKAATLTSVAGQLYSPIYLGGRPGATAFPSSGLTGSSVTSSRAGMIPVPAAVSGQQIYLAGLDMSHAGNIGAVMVVDRLWDNSGAVVTTTAGQAINSTTWPARDTSAATSGAGIMVALEVTGNLGNGTVTNTTITYTNSAGTASKTGSIASFPAAANQGIFVPFTLAAGDVGIRSIQTLTLGTSYVSGSMSLVAYRVLAVIPTPTANIAASQDFLQLGLPKIWDTSALQLLYVSTGTPGGIVQGTLNYAQG